MTHSRPAGYFHFGGQRKSFRNVTAVPQLSQNVHPQRQHAAQPDGVVDVTGVGVAGARVEQDAQTDGKELIALQYDERFKLGQVDGDDARR